MGERAFDLLEILGIPEPIDIEDDMRYARYVLPIKTIEHIIPVSKVEETNGAIFIAVERETFKELFPGKDPDDIFLNENEPIPFRAKFTIAEAVIIRNGKEIEIMLN